MNNTSPGVYGIAHKTQKETVKQISMSQAQVFNMFLQEGIELELNEANIIPLVNKYSRNKYVKYRAIGKILESIILDHEIMVDFLSKYIIFNKPFSAWVLKSKIMPNKLYIFFEEITKWGDEGSPVYIIYLELQKAFHIKE